MSKNQPSKKELYICRIREAFKEYSYSIMKTGLSLCLGLSILFEKTYMVILGPPWIIILGIVLVISAIIYMLAVIYAKPRLRAVALILLVAVYSSLTYLYASTSMANRNVYFTAWIVVELLYILYKGEYRS